MKGTPMLAFNLKRARHTLRRRRGDRIAAEICGRKLPTVETEEGRDALLPNGSLEWAMKLGLPVYSPLPAHE